MINGFLLAYSGYEGTGHGESGCSDINECSDPTNTHNCADEADCVNIAGGFSCQCRPGYSGNGYQCSG